MSQLILNEGSTPNAPTTGSVKVYAKEDSSIYMQDKDGLELGMAWNMHSQTIKEGDSVIIHEGVSCIVAGSLVIDGELVVDGTILVL